MFVAARTDRTVFCGDMGITRPFECRVLRKSSICCCFVVSDRFRPEFESESCHEANLIVV